MRNDLNYPKPNDSQTPSEKALSIFVQRAIRENRSYLGDIVKENLNSSLASGSSPQAAVDALFARANRR